VDTFVNYETDWKELRDSIKKRAELIPSTRGDAKRKEIKAAQDELADAEEIVRFLTVVVEKSVSVRALRQLGMHRCRQLCNAFVEDNKSVLECRSLHVTCYRLSWTLLLKLNSTVAFATLIVPAFTRRFNR
jgi:hypothetical protein